jgi:hypothetical protein
VSVLCVLAPLRFLLVAQLITPSGVPLRKKLGSLTGDYGARMTCNLLKADLP